MGERDRDGRVPAAGAADLRERLSHDIVRSVGEGAIDIDIDIDIGIVSGYERTEALEVIPYRRDRLVLQRICDDLHKRLKLRIEVSSFEGACRMVEAGVGVGVMPESAARRHAQAMQIGIVALADAWSLRQLHVCVRSLQALPGFAGDLVEDARSA